MIATTISGILAKDANVVRVKDRDYLSIVINASRAKEDAVWVNIMYWTRDLSQLQRYLLKGARIVASGTRYTDKVYQGKEAPQIDRTLWADAMDIVHFVEHDDLPR